MKLIITTCRIGLFHKTSTSIFGRIVFVLLCSFFSVYLFAQTKVASISGAVADKASKTHIEFATVQLLNSADSSVLNATASDKKGKFTFLNVSDGNYIIACTYISYEKIYMAISVSGRQNLNAGTMEISRFSKNMKEVVVTSKKSILNTAIDRKVYNVGEDIMSQSGSASDILKNIPSVEVDIDGGVSLRGSTGVMILINGKPSPLMGNSKADVLQQIPANSIERIEVITNPSARFKPDGSSGIINIVMKKNIKSGLNGTLIGNIGNNNRYGASVNLNYRSDKLSAFGSYGIRKDKRIRINETSRQYLDANQNVNSFYFELNQSPAKPLSNMVTLGFEYTASPHNIFGISGNYSNRKLTRADVLNRSFYDPNHILMLQTDRLRYDPESEIEKDATIFWQHNFLKEDRELRVQYNIASQDETEDNRYTNVFKFPLAPSKFDNTSITTATHASQLTVDYSQPLSKDSKIELGFDGSYQKLDPTFLIDSFHTLMGKFVRDFSRSNKFLYNEAVSAVYATYQRGYGAFSYSAGLRAEYSSTRSSLITLDSTISNEYFKFYPTLHIDYKLTNGDLQLNYSRRVHRPEADDLNPFPEYRDPRNLRSGNPKLLPEIINSIEFGYKWQNKNFSFVPSLYYRYKQNGFTQIIVPLNDSILLTTQQNLSNDQSAGLELIFSAKAGTFMTANLSANFFYNIIDGSDLGFTTKKSIYSNSTNFNTTFIITKTTMLQLSSNYRSARLTPQGKTYGTFVFNAGVRQDLFSKKLSITLTGSDLFKTLKQRSELNTPFLKQTSTGTRDAQIIYVGVAYQFGKTIKKKEEEKLQFDNNL